MRKLLFALMVLMMCLAAPSYGQGFRPKSQTGSEITTYTGEVITVAEWNQRIALIEQIIANVSAKESPYRQWSDGSISYLGKTLYVHFGIIPRPSKILGVYLTLYGYKVYDVSKDGARIAPYNKDKELSENDIYVEGLGGVYSDRSYSTPMMIKKIGRYEYSTVQGSSRTIPRYEAGTETTKEKYLEYIKSQN